MPPPDETSAADRPTPRSAPKAFGTLVPGYEIVGEIARGAMGVVYEARHQGLQRTVALKMTLSGGAASEDELLRFKREARVLASLSHPNVVQIFDCGDVDGMPYFALEYCKGGTLASRLKRGPMPVREAADVVATLAEAIAAVHRKGVIHRDLKPANVLFTEEGVLRVTDFGLVRDGDGHGTASGAVMGTPAYMSPEQARGETKTVGPCSDVYGLGAILYECLTGRAPYTGPNATNVLMQVMQGTPSPPPVRVVNQHVPLALARLCQRCLERDPKRRPAGAAEVAGELRRFLNGDGERKRGGGWMMLAVACVLLLAVSVAAVVVWLVLHAPGTQTIVVEVTRPIVIPSGQETKPAEMTKKEVDPAKVTKVETPSVPTKVVSPKPVQAKPNALKSPFTVAQAKAAQKEWAEFLGRQVEETIDLGGGEKVVMVLIPPGTFTMGSNEYDDEKPPHEVTVTKPFYLGKTEVTQGQYKALVGKNPSYFAADGGGAEKVKGMDTSRFPVETVDWKEAMSFCELVGKRAKSKATLPSEAQWEWACRAGTQTRFSFGDKDDDLGDYAWYTKNTNDTSTREVGQKKANPFGLSDMHGNVWEWCRDDKRQYTENKCLDPEGDTTSDNARVLRGGSWVDNAVYCRSANRRRATPAVRVFLLGFRVLLPLD